VADAYKILAFPGHAIPDQYKGLVTSRWLRTLKYGSDVFKLAHPPSYWSVYPKYVQAILDRPNTYVQIAVLTDDPDVALGFIVRESETAHYLHTQKDVRRQGIASYLLTVGLHPIRYFTHITRPGASLWAAKLPNAVFDPFK
jgi:hypothetical protein